MQLSHLRRPHLRRLCLPFAVALAFPLCQAWATTESWRQPQDDQAQKEQQEDEERRKKVADLMVRAFSASPAVAKGLLLEVLRLDPTNTAAVQKLNEVETRLASDQKSEAERSGRLQRKAELLRRARSAYATSLAGAGPLDEAESLTQRLLQLDPEDPEAQSLKYQIKRDRDNRRIWLLLRSVVGGLLALGLFAWAVLRRYGAGRLEVTAGPQAGERYRLRRGVTKVGALASKVDVVVLDPAGTVSRVHCEIRRSGRQYSLLDQSVNGTSLNGAAVPKGQPVLLRRGDKIALAGGAEFTFS